MVQFLFCMQQPTYRLQKLRKHFCIILGLCQANDYTKNEPVAYKLDVNASLYVLSPIPDNFQGVVEMVLDWKRFGSQAQRLKHQRTGKVPWQMVKTKHSLLNFFLTNIAKWYTVETNTLPYQSNAITSNMDADVRPVDALATSQE